MPKKLKDEMNKMIYGPHPYSGELLKVAQDEDTCKIDDTHSMISLH